MLRTDQNELIHQLTAELKRCTCSGRLTSTSKNRSISEAVLKALHEIGQASIKKYDFSAETRCFFRSKIIPTRDFPFPDPVSVFCLSAVSIGASNANWAIHGCGFYHAVKQAGCPEDYW